MKKIVFIDLDWTLIKPIQTKSNVSTYSASDVSLKDREALLKKHKELLPKGSELIESVNMLSDDLKTVKVGCFYLPVFPKDLYDWQLISPTVDALLLYIEAGYEVMIVSNQGGIESGFVTNEGILNKIASVVAAISLYALGKTGNKEIAHKCNRIYYNWCTSNKEDDYYRKPNTGLIIEGLSLYKANAVDCIMVGDMPSDKKCAANAGIKYYHVNKFQQIKSI